MTSWVQIPKGFDFSIHNIPFGIFTLKNQRGKKRVATIIGNNVVDLYELAQLGYFNDLKINKSVFKKDYLNDFIALGKTKTRAVRNRIQSILSDSINLDNSEKTKISSTFHDLDTVTLHLPVKIGDYTDFYSSEQHATNVGMMFRDPQNALLPNWKHIPVAYHGRASSIFVSGVNFHRPKGQVSSDETKPPFFTPSKRLDFELEMATVIGKNNKIGEAILIDEAEDYVFGFQLFNDWSARDIQKWEYVPLGPFLAKNFFSSVSPWVVTIDALEQFRVPAPQQTPEVLPYLKEKKHLNFDINLEVQLIPDANKPQITEGVAISRTNFKNMYWTVSQQITHHTVNGCNLNIGDLLASGTISGSSPDSFGSLLELTWGGKNPIQLPDGSSRRFLEDYDEIIIKGYAEKNGIRVGFGEVRNMVLPAIEHI